MIEQGIVQLVQTNAAVRAIAVTGGGFGSLLPKGQALPSWTYLRVSSVPVHSLQSFQGLRHGRIQIDCYGIGDSRGTDALALSKAIDDVLNGFQGILPDPDSTFVSSCLQSDQAGPFFDDAGRTYRVMLEYEIAFAED